MPHQKITQAFVDGLPYQDSGTLWVHDTELAGFNLSIGQRTKTYYAAGEHGSRFIRVKIGRADVTKANEARAVARDVLLPEIRRGVDSRASVRTTRPSTWSACPSCGQRNNASGGPPFPETRLTTDCNQGGKSKAARLDHRKHRRRTRPRLKVQVIANHAGLPFV